jgi:hypothetical protein
MSHQQSSSMRHHSSSLPSYFMCRILNVWMCTQPPMRPTSYAAATNTPLAHLAQAEHVYLRVGGQQKPLASPYAGPYLVVSKGTKTFTIQVGQRQEIIFMDRLKAHTGPSPVSPAEAVSRGRSPKTPAPLLYNPACAFVKPQTVWGGGGPQ